MTIEGKYTISDTGCWEWNKCIRGKSGYGCMKVKGKVIDSHRASYIIHKGEIPKGMLVCHTCDNRKCINPNHLFLGTYSENMQDCAKKKRLFCQQRPLKHPSITSYQRGCRCIECKKIKAESELKYKAKRK